MSTNRGNASRFWLSLLVCAFITGPLAAQTLPGIPEPGLVLYGSVLNTSAAGSNTLTSGALTWTISGNNSTSVVPATIVGVNSQFFYIARVPFETRHLGVTSFAASANTLEFSAAGANYARSVLVNGNPATIASSSSGHFASFPFGAANRGSVERVDLSISVTTETFQQWSLRFFGTTNVNPNADADADGVSNYQEYLAGTDPTNKLSLLMINNVSPDPRGGISIAWQTVPGRTYAVLRAGMLNQPFTPVQTAISATSNTTSFHDSTAVGLGPFFYRIQINPN